MVKDADPAEGGVVYVPSSALPDSHSYTDAGEVHVDGETFAVRRRDDGAVMYDWTSGPNDGYGFTTFSSPGPVGQDQHERAVRDFLSAIDPRTGYLPSP